jgi:acetyl esterase/lipase
MTQSSRRLGWWIAGILAGGAVLACAGVCVVGIGFAAFVAHVQQQALVAPVNVDARYDVPYDQAGGESLVMDIARPKGAKGKLPAVVCIHGGGWRGGDKIAFRPVIHLLAQRGFVAVSVKYRFAPKHPFPAQIEDVKSAVRYLRANADELQIDPDRIGAMGASAGGHLATLLATTDEGDDLEGTGNAGHSSAVQAAANVVGPTDLTRTFPEIVHGMLRDLVGSELNEAQQREALGRASPIEYLGGDDPPLLLVFGTADPLVPYEQATLMVEACQAAGVPCELITIEGGGHGSGGNAQEWAKANERVIRFFEEQLKGPKKN